VRKIEDTKALEADQFSYIAKEKGIAEFFGILYSVGGFLLSWNLTKKE